MLSVYLSMIDTQQDRDKFERLFHQYERCLPADYRYILSLKYAYDCSSAQMAALLNCSEKLARVKLSRARKSLMNRLEHPQKKSGR